MTLTDIISQANRAEKFTTATDYFTVTGARFFLPNNVIIEKATVLPKHSKPIQCQLCKIGELVLINAVRFTPKQLERINDIIKTGLQTIN